jgi:hypothetical protein
MRVAKGWDKLSAANNLREALRLLSEGVSEDDGHAPGLGVGGHERPCRGETDDWLTPRYILDALGEFDLDPCAATGQPWATARRHLTVHEDGLKEPWAGRVWPVANGIFFLKGRICFCRPDGRSAAEAGALSVLLSYDPRPGPARRNHDALKGCGLPGQFLAIR